MSSPNGRAKPPRLMIVDDNARMADVTARLLSAHGYDAVAFSSPHDALAAVEAGDFDVVVTDFSMPEMAGEDFVLAVRQRCPELPIIVSTGWPEALPDAVKQRLGIQEVLCKPWRIEDAIGALERTLG